MSEITQAAEAPLQTPVMQHCSRSVKIGRPAPKFWWDFVGNECHVLVQSDWPGGEALAIFKANPGEQYRDAQISQAEALIADYKDGRKTPPWGARAA